MRDFRLLVHLPKEVSVCLESCATETVNLPFDHKQHWQVALVKWPAALGSIKLQDID